MSYVSHQELNTADGRKEYVLTPYIDLGKRFSPILYARFIQRVQLCDRYKIIKLIATTYDTIELNIANVLNEARVGNNNLYRLRRYE